MLQALSQPSKTNTWFIESDDPNCINKAGKRGNTLTLWHRQPQPELVDAVRNLPHAIIPDKRFTGSLDDLSSWLTNFLEHIPDNHQRDFQCLTSDIEHVAQWFDQRWHAEQYIFRIHPLSETMCPRFHTDHGAMRLLCTYRGPGTEWVQEDGVNRKALRTIGTTNDTIVPRPQAIHTIPNFTAALLCGCDAQGNGGVVHRSPKVPAGDNRITFCMTLTD